MITAYYYRDGEARPLDINNILQEDAIYFEKNNIKVSMEELAGEIIVYGCPWKDTSEESEVVVFAKGKTCKETMSELAKECKAAFGVE